MRKRKKQLLRIVLSIGVLLGLFAPAVSAAGMSLHAAWTGVANGEYVVKDTVTQITQGVVEHEVITNVASGNDQKIDYNCFIQMSDTIKLAAGYGHDDASSWGMVSTTAQAAAYEKNHPGETVVAALNADFFNMGTGEPLGALVMEGTVYHEANNRWYFAVLKDGTPVIRNTPDLSDCEMAVGGYLPLIKDGVAVESSYAAGTDDYTRCTIGIMADGTIVTSVTHGRLYPVSCGRTYQEIAEMLLAQGCVDALVLDGGGSSTFAARVEGSDRLEVRNSPSDGAEREVSSSILIVSKAEATGVFDHAALLPNNEVYTPGSEVQFEADGVDTAGFPAELPEDVTWALVEDSSDLGTIDAKTGLFTAGENTGVVTVELRQGEAVIGMTSIEVAVPDEIYFGSEEVSLGFEEETDLGIVVRNAGRDIHYKDGDLFWTSTEEGLGTFKGNLFIANAENSLSGTVTAASAYGEGVSGSLHVIVGMLPTLVWDFEDVTDETSGEVTLAEDYYTGESGILSTSNYGRGGKQSVEIVSIDDDEPVRFGSHSLKLNYDFTDCGAVTDGACVGTSTAAEIPGSPTGIGVWVYAPEGVGVTYDGKVSGLWLRGYVKDGNGNVMPYDFTLEPKNVTDSYDEETGTYTVQPGIYWEGWMYLEADLTKMTGPFSIQKGMTFRLMYVYGTGMVGNQRSGAIYFDNLQFVYGTNVDDTDNPVIDSIRVNDVELENGMTLDTDTISVNAYFHDVQNKYTTGIDTGTVRMYIDGINVVDNENYQYVLEPDGSIGHLYDARLLNGTHSITVSLRDGFGNETSETRYFTIESDQAADITEVSVNPVEDAAVLGKTVTLNVQATNNDIASCTTQMRLGSLFKDYKVEFSDNYEGTSEYSNLSGTLTIKAERKADAAADDSNVIASLIVEVPSTLTEGADFSYTVKGGSYVTTAGDYATYSAPEKTLPVAAAYQIAVDPVIVGAETTVTVKDTAGAYAANVGLYLADSNELIGTTDENGQWVTDYFSKEAGTVAIYAKDEAGLLSFQYKVNIYAAAGAESGLPYGIMFHGVNNSESQKSISWFSNVALAGKQKLQYRISQTEDWATVAADGEQRTFSAGGNSAVMVNSVILSGLSSGTTYEYRVGCEETGWSEADTFTTSSAGSDGMNFFVISDIQAEDTTNISNIMNNLKDGNYAFGIQTGDAVDNAASYSDWMDMTALFGTDNLGDLDMIHVLGNHEYAGDANGATATAVYNLPEAKAGSYYSLTYGDVYMAVINYTGTGSQLREALDWMIADAQASKAIWKVLLMHQPAYYTNASGGNGEIYNMVPDAVEAAGINVVFSGHDHTLARTNLIYDDQIDEDKGVLYYIGGSAGEKSYSITSKDIFDFDTIFAIATQDFTATYLTASVDTDKLTINIHDLDRGLMDSITLYSACVKNGHKYQYDAEKTCAVCTVCGTENPDYTGEIQDAEENGYYLIGGKLQTGWTAIGTDNCYFNPDTGIKEKVEKTTDIATTCLETGYYILTAESGATAKYSYAKAPGHEYTEQEDGTHVCSVCGYTRVELDDCTITLPFTTATYTGVKKSPYPTVTAPDGTVLTGNSVDFYVNYSDNIEVGTATVTVTAKSGFNANLTDFRGNYGGKVQLTFKIVPADPTSLTAVLSEETGEVSLSWKAGKGAEEYIIYTTEDDGENWDKIATTSETSYLAKGLNAGRTYMFRVRSAATVDGEEYYSRTYGTSNTVTTAEGKKLEDCTVTQSWKSTVYNGSKKTYGTASLSVKNADGEALTRNVDYEVAYSNHVNVGTATVTLTGIGQYQGQKTVTFTINAQSLTNTSAAAVGADAVYDPSGSTTTFEVKDKNGRSMTEGVDYTVTYSHNVGVGVATAKITGIGNYKGSLTTEFNILPKDIADTSAAVAAVTYTGSELCPAVEIAGLTEGEDFSVVYENNVNVGTANAVVTGMGNYTGTKTVVFEISAAGIESAVITDGSTYSYTGQEIIPDLNVTTGDGTLLVLDQDYRLDALENNVNVGTASVTVCGIGNYTGSVKYEFVIQGADITAFTVTLEPEEYVYSGKERKPVVTVTDLSGAVLEAETDYTVEYSDNIKAGTATVAVTGKGNYAGIIERKFTILPADLTACNAALSYTSTVFSGAEKKPAVTVKTAKGTTLKKDTNYTVSYSENRNAGTATVTVTGINNYAGTLTKTFEIKPKSITGCQALASRSHITLEDGRVVPQITVKTAAGTVLKNGLNYTVEYTVEEGVVTAVITGIGNYTGELSLTVESATDLSGFQTKLSYNYANYSGKAKRPTVTVTAPDGTVLKKGTNYTVVYEDNVEIGTAMVHVTGKGAYYGNIDKTFTIRPVAPTNVKVAAVTASTIKISFDRNEMADKYYIYVNGRYVGCALTVNYYTIKGLTSSTDYKITVKAVTVVDGVNVYSSASGAVTGKTK